MRAFVQKCSFKELKTKIWLSNVEQIITTLQKYKGNKPKPDILSWGLIANLNN